MSNNEMTDTNIMNTATESGVKKAAENVFNRAVNALVDFGKKKYGERQVSIGTVFQNYLNNATLRYNQVRTLATGLEPRTIIGDDEIYVAMNIHYQKEEIDTSNIYSLLNISNNIIILGTGGLGKSMLMRYLFLNTAQIGDYVPVMLELRRISNQSPGCISILDLIYTCMQEYDVQLPREQFEYSLRSGKYIFLMDGFDEVKEVLSVETAEAIQRFCSKYPQNPCIITSRHERDMSPLETFTYMELNALNKGQAVRLASKIWKEDEKTREFCNQLDKMLYDRHKSFAENPLLLSMMFLTFMRNNSIPDHLADFYQKSYEALYSAHDNNDKGYYRRDFKCKHIGEREFKLILAHFCFHSYFDEKYEFTSEAILKCLDKSLKKFGFKEISAENYLLDLCDVVCIVVKDGDIYRFSHRSFQTYFAAYYTSESLTDEQQNKLFYSVLSGKNVYWTKDDYYKLLLQIEPERFAINALEKALRDIQRATDNDSEPEVFFLQKRMSAINIIKEEEYNTISYTTPGVGNMNYYYSNVIEMFMKYILKIKELDIIDGDFSLAMPFINNMCRILFSVEVCKMKYITLKFDEIDQSDDITYKDRQDFYVCVNRFMRTTYVRQKVRDWLSSLDLKRKTLNCPNFIDNL